METWCSHKKFFSSQRLQICATRAESMSIHKGILGRCAVTYLATMLRMGLETTETPSHHGPRALVRLLERKQTSSDGDGV